MTDKHRLTLAAQVAQSRKVKHLEAENSKLRAQNATLREALEDMCHQYLRVRKGKLHHDFMSAGENAFDALGWDDAGHPLPPEDLCDVPGCGESPDCGWPTKSGYRRACSKHHREALEKGDQ